MASERKKEGNGTGAPEPTLTRPKIKDYVLVSVQGEFAGDNPEKWLTEQVQKRIVTMGGIAVDHEVVYQALVLYDD